MKKPIREMTPSELKAFEREHFSSRLRPNPVPNKQFDQMTPREQADFELWCGIRPAWSAAR